ncbi:MAG: T9SS type A sorting domain-containing protein [Bacteroidales bacterium]|nr:T9SS type A sorting domain-containing protein [Bacteroidales bacterium]
MINYLESGGSFYIESVDIGLNHTGTTFFDYLGLMYINDGAEQEVVKLKSGPNNVFADLSYYYLGGYDPHYSVDRLESNNGSDLMFSSEDGYGRMFVNDNIAYKSIASSIIFGAFANGDTLSLRPFLVSEMVNFFIGYNPVTSLKENISQFISTGNYPNPFATDTRIEYTLNETGFVNIDVYNLKGQIVKQLVAEQKNPGDYYVIWDATNNIGSVVESGYYFYKISVGEYTQTEKMILLR